MSATLLLVDDDEFFRAMTQEVLEQGGYTVDSAEDGLAGWDALDKSPCRFDLVLLDKHMPRLDGISLLRRIKEDSRFEHLPVLMLSGDGLQGDILEGLAAGAYYYLTKPSTEYVLKRVIKNALDELDQKRELRSLIGQQTNSLNLIHRAEFCYRSLSEAKDLAVLLANASMDPARTVGGYSELLINAVEHGNLGISYAEKGRLLDEGRWSDEVEARLRHPDYAERLVHVSYEKTAAASLVTITDQGDGFEWSMYIEFSPERVFELHGRGIAMSKALSFDSLEYLGKGNSVVATVLRPDSLQQA